MPFRKKLYSWPSAVRSLAARPFASKPLASPTLSATPSAVRSLSDTSSAVRSLSARPFFVLLFAIALLLLSVVPAVPAPVASAATVELTATVKASFDKTVAEADSATKTKLSSLYAELDALLKADKEAEAKIKALHYRNEETLIALRKQIREIDAAKLSKLDEQVKQTKARYQPLFDAYSALNKQISMAKSLKNKTLNVLLKTQADGMKLSVQFAREDIRAKEAAHKAAKTAASNKMKAARDYLAAIDPIGVQIKAQRSAAGLPRGSLSPAWSNFKYAIKNKEAKSAQGALATLVSLAKQIVAQQEKIYALETKIGEIAAKTKNQFL